MSRVKWEGRPENGWPWPGFLPTILPKWNGVQFKLISENGLTPSFSHAAVKVCHKE